MCKYIKRTKTIKKKLKSCNRNAAYSSSLASAVLNSVGKCPKTIEIRCKWKYSQQADRIPCRESP